MKLYNKVRVFLLNAIDLALKFLNMLIRPPTWIPEGKKATVAGIVHRLMQEASSQATVRVQQLFEPFAKIFKEVG